MMRAATANKAIMPGEEQPYSSFFIILTPVSKLKELFIMKNLTLGWKLPKILFDCQMPIFAANQDLFWVKKAPMVL